MSDFLHAQDVFSSVGSEFTDLIFGVVLSSRGDLSLAQKKMIVQHLMMGYHFSVESLEGVRKASVPAARVGISNRLRDEVLLRDGFVCLRCESSEDLELDHVVPVFLGGLTVFENLQTLCGRCNRTKGTDGVDYRVRTT